MQTNVILGAQTEAREAFLVHTMSLDLDVESGVCRYRLDLTHINHAVWDDRYPDQGGQRWK